MTIRPLNDDREGIVQSWLRTPVENRIRRIGLVAIAGVGLTVTMLFSLFAMQAGPIPLKWFPDARPLLMFGTTMLVGVYASFGSSSRRSHFLYYVVAIVVLFHLDEATIHWLFGWDGPIGNTRIDIIRTPASIVAVATALLLQADHHAITTARDLAARGIDPAEAGQAATALYAGAQRRVVSLAAGGSAVALALRVIELLLGSASFGAWGGVLIGAILLAGVAMVARRGILRTAGA